MTIDTIITTTAIAFFLGQGILGIYLAAKIYNTFIGKGKWTTTGITIIMMFLSIMCLLTAAAFAGLLS